MTTSFLGTYRTIYETRLSYKPPERVRSDVAHLRLAHGLLWPPAMSEKTYEVFGPADGRPIKSWTVGVPFESQAREQLERIASLPFIHKWVAAMPDVHQGKGATVGS